MNNSRFALAVHVLALLALENKPEPTTSEYLACSAGTHAVVVRRILGALQRAGLVNAQPGVGGGVTLACQPEVITLYQIYRAVDEGELFSLGARKPSPDSKCGRNIQPILVDVFAKSEQAVAGALAQITLAQIVGEIERSEARLHAERSSA